MNIAKSIQHLYPNAKSMIDFVVQDDSDGNGAYIAQWNLLDPQPTQAELEAAWGQIKDLPKPLSEIELLKEENEVLKQRATQNSADLQGFMDYYFSLNPE